MKTLFLLLALAVNSFAAIQYAGGTNVNVQCTASLGTKQELADCIEDSLNTAGWTTNSGHHTPTIVLQSVATPTAGLQMIVTLTQGSTSVNIKASNVAGTRGAATGMFLLPGIGKVFRVIADKYQGFVSVDGTPGARSTAAFGTPYVPTFVGVTEAIWANGNGASDGDTSLPSTWKLCLTLNAPNNTCGNSANAAANIWVTLNGTQWENTGSSTADQPGVLGLVNPSPTTLRTSSFTLRNWFDGSYFISEPLMGWAATAFTATATVVGQLWDAAIITTSIPSETALVIDSHNWLAWTNSNAGSVINHVNGTLILVTP